MKKQKSSGHRDAKRRFLITKVLADKGVSRKDIMEMVGISKSTLERYMQFDTYDELCAYTRAQNKKYRSMAGAKEAREEAESKKEKLVVSPDELVSTEELLEELFGADEKQAKGHTYTSPPSEADKAAFDAFGSEEMELHYKNDGYAGALKINGDLSTMQRNFSRLLTHVMKSEDEEVAEAMASAILETCFKIITKACVKLALNRGKHREDIY